MSQQPTACRRAIIAGSAGILGGLTGCAAVLSSDSVSILAAGSLSYALETGLQPSVSSPLQIETHGSATVARMVAEQQKTPDIISVADTALFDGPLSPAWHAEFATNALVITYNPTTDGGKDLEAADRWYRPLLAGKVTLGRTDPDLDPLGYRTLFMLELASEYYGTDRELRATIPERKQIYPETQLVSKFETGAIDAAVTYRNMAIERGYPYLDLPKAIDLSDPAYADQYATTEYELPSGKTVTGGPIKYGSTLRTDSPTAREVFKAHITGEYLTESGFTIPKTYPQYTGNVPETIPN